MPINYTDYPSNWKTEIVPSILKRGNNCCKFCKVPNKEIIFRGKKPDGSEIFQDDDGNIYSWPDGKNIGENYVGDIPNCGKLIQVILTVAHLDHDNQNNSPENLAALCQKCHLNHDKVQHLISRTRTIREKRGIQSLF